MALNEALQSPNLKAVRFESDVAEGQAVKLGAGSKSVTAATAPTDIVVGFAAYDSYKNGDSGQIFTLFDEAIAVAGAAIRKGVYVSIGASGKLVPVGANPGETSVVGIAMEAATGADQLIKILPLRFVHPA